MTPPPFAWLPDHQLGVAATLAHADELIGEVSDLLFTYQNGPDGVLGLEEQVGFPNTRTVVTRIEPMPRKVALLVADALVALRASIEHALFAEIESRDGPLDEKAARLVEIPASDTDEKFEDWLQKRARKGPPSLRAGSDLVRRIEGLQPFNRTDADEHPLARLVLHTNHAKHRTPAVTAVRIAAMYQEDTLPSSIREPPPRSEEPLRVDDVIAETPIGAQVQVAIFPTIGINRPGTDRWPMLMKELDEISWWVREQAVPRLITGTERSEMKLPARYDISHGHDDERGAMAAGHAATAIERYKQRLGAASARVDLVDVVDRVHGSPGREQLSAWLAHLSDEEVLDRVSRLSATRAFDHDVELRVVEVAEGLRDEALAFHEGDTS